MFSNVWIKLGQSMGKSWTMPAHGIVRTSKSKVGRRTVLVWQKF